jgi:hypothetical protein
MTPTRLGKSTDWWVVHFDDAVVVAALADTPRRWQRSFASERTPTQAHYTLAERVVQHYLAGTPSSGYDSIPHPPVGPQDFLTVVTQALQ